MNNDAITAGHKIDNLAHRGGVLITGHYQGTRRNLDRVTSLIQERSQITGLILIFRSWLQRQLHAVANGRG